MLIKPPLHVTKAMKKSNVGNADETTKHEFISCSYQSFHISIQIRYPFNISSNRFVLYLPSQKFRLCMFWNNVLKGLDKWESPLSCKNRFCRRFGLCLCHRRTYNLHLHDRAIYIIKVGSCKQVNKVYFNMCLAID